MVRARRKLLRKVGKKIVEAEGVALV